MEQMRLLLVEDNPEDVSLIRKILVASKTRAFEITDVGQLDKALSWIAKKDFDVILLDLSLTDGQGIDNLNRIRAASPHSTVIVMSDLDDDLMATNSLQEGSKDYIFKGLIDSNMLLRVIQYAIERNKIERKLRQAEDKLRESEAKYRSLVEQIPAITYIDTLEAVTVYVSPQVQTMLGYSQEECLAGSEFWLDRLHPDDRERVQTEYQQSRISGKPFASEYRLIAQNGQALWVRDQAVLVRDDKGEDRYIQGVIIDITETKKMEESMKNLAYYDPLTNLPNRLLFKDRCDLAIAHAKRYNEMFAVMFLDLDNFKVINDTLGHEMGDQFLKVVAQRLTSLLRGEDTVSRLGGDEFILLFTGISQMEGTAKIAQRIIEIIRQPWILGVHEFHITASIGISIYSDHGEDVETLMRNADIAMYKAKKKGRNRCQFYSK